MDEMTVPVFQVCGPTRVQTLLIDAYSSAQYLRQSVAIAYFTFAAHCRSRIVFTGTS